MQRIHTNILVTIALSALLVGCNSDHAIRTTEAVSSASATQAVVPTELALSESNVYLSSSVSVSPDKKWIASTAWVSLSSMEAGPLGQKVEVNIVDSADTSKSRVALRKWLPVQSGMYGLDPIHWGADGSYVDIGQWWAPDGCALGQTETEWTRFDLVSGDSIVLATATVVAFSPDRYTLAYSYGLGTKQRLVVRKSGSDVVRETPLPTSLGSIIGLTWSPDESELAMLFVSNPCDPNQERRSIAIIGAQTMVSRTLVSESADLVALDDWSAAEGLLVLDRGQMYHWMHAQTGEYVGEPISVHP